MIAEPSETRLTRSVSTKSVVIIGGGVAGNMAAETLKAQRLYRENHNAECG